MASAANADCQSVIPRDAKARTEQKMAAKKRATITRAIVAKARKVLEFAQQRAREVHNRHELSNALYTTGGFASVTFPTESERNAFCKTKEYDQIVELIVSLPDPPLSDEVIVIRIPPSENGKRRKR
jgi:hypothetical protein